MTGHLAIPIFVWIGVVITALSCLSLVLSIELLDRLHFMAPVANVGAVAILIAIVLQEGWGQALVKMLLICAVLIIMNAVLAHATARAARVREFGSWTPRPDEHIRGTRSAEPEDRQGSR